MKMSFCFTLTALLFLKLNAQAAEFRVENKSPVFLRSFPSPPTSKSEDVCPVPEHTHLNVQGRIEMEHTRWLYVTTDQEKCQGWVREQEVRMQPSMTAHAFIKSYTNSTNERQGSEYQCSLLEGTPIKIHSITESEIKASILEGNCTGKVVWIKKKEVSFKPDH